MQKHLSRLDRVWAKTPIYFVTTCTKKRRAILAQKSIAEILLDEWSTESMKHGWLVGRYVIMPDHVHFFCAPERETKSLSDFVGAWKRWTSWRINTLLGPWDSVPDYRKGVAFLAGGVFRSLDSFQLGLRAEMGLCV